MRRVLVLSFSMLLLSAAFAEYADARPGGGYRGGGGFRGGAIGGGYRAGFAGGGYRGGAIGTGYRGGFSGSGYRAGAIGPGVGRPGWGAGDIGRPGRPGWGVGWRPGWGGGWHGWGYPGRWPLYGAAVGLGLAGASYYNSYAPYGYGGYATYGYGDECSTVQQPYWDGYSYQVGLVNSCYGY